VRRIVRAAREKRKEGFLVRKLLLLVLALAMVLTQATALAEPVQVTMLKSAGGNDSNIELWRDLATQFEQWTGGKYTLSMEEIPGVAVDVRTKLKMLNAANNLPAIVTDMGAEPAFAELLMTNNRLIDLKPSFDADADWQKTVFESSVAFNTRDGKMYSSPATATSYVGVYYNKELFKNAGIEKFPETWDEFWDACEKIKATGVAPLSLHTTETGWCTMLLATAYASQHSEEGAAFLNQNFPTDYNNPEMLDMAEFIRKLFNYTTSDAIGGTYSLAANNFCAGKTAMIANGPWMSDSLYDTQYAPEGFAEKVGYVPFPGNTMLTDQGELYGYGVSADVSEEQQQGAIEFIKFLARPEVINQFTMATGEMSHLVSLPDEMFEKLTPIMKEYAAAVEKTKRTAPRYQAKWDSVVQTEVIEQELPNLAQDIITPQQFVDKLTEGAQRYASEVGG
jgi:raffinose/stachyose/melibiose transport system substrate-binding protein